MSPLLESVKKYRYDFIEMKEPGVSARKKQNETRLRVFFCLHVVIRRHVDERRRKSILRFAPFILSHQTHRLLSLAMTVRWYRIQSPDTKEQKRNEHSTVAHSLSTTHWLLWRLIFRIMVIQQQYREWSYLIWTSSGRCYREIRRTIISNKSSRVGSGVSATNNSSKTTLIIHKFKDTGSLLTDHSDWMTRMSSIFSKIRIYPIRQQGRYGTERCYWRAICLFSCRVYRLDRPYWNWELDAD